MCGSLFHHYHHRYRYHHHHHRHHTIIMIWKSCVSKSKLCDWESWFISKEAAVFTPFSIINVTIIFKPLFLILSALFTWFIHAACAFVTARQCSTPVSHFLWVPRYPPSKPSFSTIPGLQQPEVNTFILDKLLTVWGDFSETHQLRQICSYVMNVTWVAPTFFAAIHHCCVLAVVTDDCHANSIRVNHVTSDDERR